jgi:hypothetical protein
MIFSLSPLQDHKKSSLKGRHWRPVPILLVAVYMCHTEPLCRYMQGTYSSIVVAALAMPWTPKLISQWGEKPPNTSGPNSLLHRPQSSTIILHHTNLIINEEKLAMPDSMPSSTNFSLIVKNFLFSPPFRFHSNLSLLWGKCSSLLMPNPTKCALSECL